MKQPGITDQLADQNLNQQELMDKFSNLPDQEDLDFYTASSNMSDMLRHNNIQLKQKSGDIVANDAEITPERQREMFDMMQIQGVGASNDPYKIAKPVPGNFNNPNYQNQFYERYYEHPAFDELGFTPFRDNETLYNENSTAWGDFRRAWGEWGTLARLGFEDMLGFGDLSDESTAAEYERAMAVGSSSRGGAGGFATNLFLNSGYTVGIMGELALEEIAMLGAEIGLGAAGLFTGGTTWAAAGAVGARMGRRATQAWNKVLHSFKAAGNLKKTLDNMNDINKARKYFANSGKSFLNFLNPLENTTGFISKSRRLMKDANVPNISTFETAMRGFGAFYRDVRNVRAAYSEGALEGGMVENTLSQELWDDFIATNGRPPSNEEALEMRMRAKEAGAATSLINAPTIFYSNKIVLDGLLHGKFKTSTLTDAGKLGKRILYNPRAAAKEAYTVLSKNPFKRMLQVAKHPRAYANKLGMYGAANWTEGVQEIAQEAISAGIEDYYKTLYHEGGDATYGGWLSAVANGMSKHSIGQNVETFLSGFLMGGLVSPMANVAGSTIHAKDNLQNLATRFTNKEKYTEMKQEVEDTLEKDVEMLNELNGQTEHYLAKDMINLMEQKQFADAMKKAKEEGDMKSFYDMKDSSLVRHITTALRYGRFDSTVDRLRDMNKLSDEEISEMGYTPSEFREAMAVSIDRAESIQRRWNKAPKNPINIGDYKRGSFAWKQAINKKKAWDDAVEEMVFNQYSFDRALDRQKSIFGKLANIAGAKGLASTDISTLLNQGDLVKKMAALEQELKLITGEMGIKGTEPLTPEMKAMVAEKKKNLQLLRNFDEAITSIKENKEAKVTDAQYAKVEKAYKNYMQFLAQNTDQTITQEELGEVLQDIIDYIALDVQSKEANDAVTALTDPHGFLHLVDKAEQLHNNLRDNQKEFMRASLEKFNGMKAKNVTLRELADELGMFVDPEEFLEFTKTGKAPKSFYYLDDGGSQKSEALVSGSDYRKAIGILRKHLKDYNLEDITDIALPESVLNPLFLKSHDKDVDDNRNYDELAKQFGFDPEAETSTVPLTAVLGAVIRSKHATPREVALAEEMLKVAGSQEKVTFSRKENLPASYKVDSIDQSVVDARYASEGYEGSGNLTLEFLILHAETQRRVMTELKNDAAFKDRLELLREEAIEYMKTLPDTDANKKNLAINNALGSVEAFAVASMTNQEVQNFLARIETKSDTGELSKNSWGAFVKAILDQVAKFLGNTTDGTVLNGALNTITTKLQDVYAEGPKKATSPETRKGTVKTTEDTGDSKGSTGDLIHRSVSDAEWTEFETKNQVSRGRLAMIANQKLKSEPLTAREKEIEKLFSAEIQKIIAAKKQPVPAGITRAMKRTLRSELGYNTKGLPVHVAKKLIDENVPSSERAELSKRISEPKNTKSKQAIQDELLKPIRDAADGEELDVATSEADELLRDNAIYYSIDGGVTGEMILEEAALAKERLAAQINFATVNKGEIVIMNDEYGNFAEVIEKTGDSITVRYTKINKEKTISKENVAKEVRHTYRSLNSTMERTDYTEPTEEEAQAIEKSEEHVQSTDSIEDIKNDVNTGEKKSSDDVYNDLFNSSIC